MSRNTIRPVPHTVSRNVTRPVQVIEAMAQERSHQTRVFDTLTAKLSHAPGPAGSVAVGGSYASRGAATPTRHGGYGK